MRTGLTTGTCAAAAAKAAALALLGTPPTAVEIALPEGEVVIVPIEFCELVSANSARAGVVKDAGDDPDVTGGSRVIATLVRGGAGVRFRAGDGVGTVTKAGLQLEPGEPAINPVPREMIAAALATVFGEAGADGQLGAEVTISIPGGTELAAKTLNPRLGIEGGLSVIGTTGRVEPKSSEAWMRSLLPQVDVVLAAGHCTVWVTTGGLGERFAVEELGAPSGAVVQCANFVGDVLDRSAEAGAERVVLVGHAGKLVKLAAGLFDTHSSTGDARLETLAALAAAEGAAPPLVQRLLALPTVQAAIAELRSAGLERTWDAVAERAAGRASQRCDLPVDVVLIGYEQELLGASGQAPAEATRAGSRGGLAVVGVGPGAEDLITPAAWREIRSADVVAGGVRLLDAFAPPEAERIEIAADVGGALGRVREKVAAGRRVVVIASGDPGFFGILASVHRDLSDLDVRVVPGISSAQLALARVGVGWHDVAFASAHGRGATAAIDACGVNPRTLVLTDRKTTPAVIAQDLAARGVFEISVLERLGYPDERVTTGSAEEIAAGAFDPLAVVLVTKGTQ